VDSDVLLLDCRYLTDARAATNRRVLDQLRQDAADVRVTTQVLLEVVGILSFQTGAADIPQLPAALTVRYGLGVVPDPALFPDSVGWPVTDIVGAMTRKLALGDAMLALQVERFAPTATALLTWNAKHFRGKVAVPVLTPEEWLLQHPPAGPTP
jgi:hypothetical protein